MELSQEDAARALLRWYAEMGVDEAVGNEPADFASWTAQKAAPMPTAPAYADARPAPPLQHRPPPELTKLFRPAPGAEAISADEAVIQAETTARAADSIEALSAAVEAFEGCPLKAGASKTVFIDGAHGADLLVIGEGPGRDEDRIGKPFVGRAGQLLDRMLAAIGRSRDENVLISNVVYWRPPGNRAPTPQETAVCRPFVDRLIELNDPKAIILAGGAPLQALFGVSGIMRARGRWRDIETQSGKTYPALPIFHPAFLLRQPANKRLAWADLQTVSQRLRDG